MKTRTAARLLGSAAFLGVSVFGLAACSSGNIGNAINPNGSANVTAQTPVYQFDEARVADQDNQEPFVTTESTVVVKLSDELKAAVPAGEKFTVDQYTVTSKAFSTGICRIDIVPTYADGGEEWLTTHGTKASPTENLATNLSISFAPGGSKNDEIVDTAPNDDEVATEATYITTDHSVITRVGKCNDTADDWFIGTTFPLQGTQPTDAFDAFARTRITIIASGGQDGSKGVTTIIRGNTKAKVSATGKWQAATN